jgi:hypothetical protein
MPETTHNWQKHRLLLMLCAAAGIAAIMLRIFDPATSGMFPPCPLRYLTGWYCPGCGSLRAIHALLHGDFHTAWAMNPLTIVLLPFLMYGLVSQVLRASRGEGLPNIFIPAIWIRALALVIVIFGIVRNIPVDPFDWLAPGAMLRF